MLFPEKIAVYSDIHKKRLPFVGNKLSQWKLKAGGLMKHDSVF
jgi:hypothetical protein